jgi:hypothetical protein
MKNMKKFYSLCLLLIIIAIWSFSSAGAMDESSSAYSSHQLTKEKKQKVVEGQPTAADEMTPDKAARIAEAVGEKPSDPAEAVESDGTPGIGIARDRYPSITVESKPHARIDFDRPVSIMELENAGRNDAEFRMRELKADGVIDEGERAEYEQLRSEASVIELPVPLNIVSESEPNNDCASADPIACGDTVWCAAQTAGTDDHDWFVFTLDNTYPSWQVAVETHPTGGSCPPTINDTFLELWTGDCRTFLASDDDGGIDWYSLIEATLLPGTYAIHEDNTHYYMNGSYHLSLICAEDTCYGHQPPGNYCASVTPVVLTPGVPFTFTGNNECAVNECSFFPGGHVWIAFTTTLPSNITLEYCNSTGFWGNAWLNLTNCPCTNFSNAADYNFACADGNVQMQWSSFPPGTYYYPVMLDPAYGSVGDYSVTVRADSLPPFWSCVDDPPGYTPPDGKLPGGVGDIEPNNTCAEAVMAQCEYAYCGALADANDADWYYVDIPADTTYGLHIRVFGEDTRNQYAYGQGLDPRVELFGPDCTTLIAMSEDYFGAFPDAEVCDSQIDVGWPNCFAPGTRVYLKIWTYNGAPGPYLLIINCEPCYLPEDFGSWECPTTNMLFGQPPHTPSEMWSAGTSEADVNGSNYKLFESFENAGEITDIHFWGWKAVLNEQTNQWENCLEEPMTFLIEFWLDDGTGSPNIAPGPVYSYNINIVGLYMDSLYWGYINAYEWSAVFPVPCTLSSGFVSIQGQLDPDCWFLWLSSPVGDGHSWMMKNGRLNDYEFDNSFCLTGTSMDVYGACCDDTTGTCTDYVEQQQCPPLSRFWPNTLCADLDPPCGLIPGACCDPATGNCIVTLEDTCITLGWNYQGDWTDCDPNPCPPPPPPNDSCQDAIIVAVPSDTPGYTISATPDTLTCEVDHFSNSVWYKVIGTGNTITASLCDAATDYDTKIQVWCNNCTSPVCVGGNDDDVNCIYSSLQSTFSWCSELGAEYLILVGGWDVSSGNFVLHVYDDGIPCSTPPDCTPPIGRCCYNDDQDCADVSLEDCMALGGYWIDLLNCRDYPCASCPAGQDKIIVDLTTDLWPDEITWEIYEREVGLIASAGPYSSPNTNYVYEICVDQGGCYDWYIYDSYGDGGAAYDLYYDGTLVHSSSGRYGFGESVFDLGNSGCGDPTGACCIGSECVATNTQNECDGLGGMWYFGEDCAAFECPPFGCNSSSLFSQNPTPPEGFWAFGNSEPIMDSGPGYVIFENFSGLTDDICVIHFWGAQMYVSPNWHDCGEDPVPFVLTFYADNGGIPDTANPLCAYVDTISAIGTGQIYPGEVELKYYEAIIDPCCSITDGWISIAGGGDPACWFMWLSSGEVGSGSAYQMWMDSGTLYPIDYDLSLCLAPAAGGCDYVVGDVNGSTSYNGLDITYGVAFFKGGPEPMCPDCQVNDCGSWNYCGDVNSSCSYNGLDITYGVSYFKGGAGPIPCPDCPPLGAATAVREKQGSMIPSATSKKGGIEKAD